MPHDLTVIYYTSNREDERFETKIRAHLLQTIGDTPLISVSQRPIAFGKNICVGDVGRSGHNVFRQYQIGVQEAETPYVCPAESDCLYPSAFFGLRPTVLDHLAVALPVHLVFMAGRGMGKFWPKRHCEAAVVAARDACLKKLDVLLNGTPLWRDGVEKGPELGDPHPDLFGLYQREYYMLPQSVLSFRTANQMHRKTPFRDDWVAELPGWGTPADVRALVA